MTALLRYALQEANLKVIWPSLCSQGLDSIQRTSFFFFQAEAGIRGHCVTGVQTCALPIFLGCTVVSTITRDSSDGLMASVLVATARLSWSSACNRSSPMRWRQRSEE